MAVSVGLLKKAIAREGWLEKAKQAKSGKDEMRGGWKPRYFVLDGHHLRYFKKEDQKTSKTKAAGMIELKDGKIDAVEPEKTEGRRHCFKVQSSDYNYTYIQAPNEEEREWWVYTLRKAAKYDDPQSMYHMKLLDPEAAKKEKDKEEKEKAAATDKAEKAVSPEKKADGKSPTTSPTGATKKKVEGKLSSEEPPGTFASDSSTADETWVAAWGFGQNGELGDIEGKVELAPVVVAALTKLKVLSVAAGRSHAAAVTDKGRLYVWGLGEEMQLGLGSRIKQSKAPTMQTRLVRETVVQAACGDNHTMCLTHTGEVYSWGDGTKGQLGHGDLKSLEFPTVVDRISKAEKKCRMIAASGDNSAGIINEYICVWGVNEHGQLGIPDPEPRPKPGAITELPLKDDKIKQIELGASFAAVVMESGTLWAVGNNSHGQCGHTAKADHHIIRQVLLASQSGSKCVQVSCGSTHMIAIIRSNDGKNSAYIFGEVDSKNSGKLGQAAVLPGGHYAASSHSHFLVLVPEGGSKSKVWGCGKNEFGQLGTGNVKPVTTYTQSVISNELEIIQVACGHQFSVGLFKGSPPDKLVEGTVDKYETAEEREAKQAKLAEEKAKAKAEEEKKKKEAEEAEKKKKEDEDKRKQAKLAILREHYGDIKPCSVKGCISGRKGGNIHCERHFESPSLPIDPEALPPVWQKLKHEKNDKFYYVNTTTKKTQWKKPEFDISLLHE